MGTKYTGRNLAQSRLAGREAGLQGHLRGRLAVHDAIKSFFMAAKFCLDKKYVHCEEGDTELKPVLTSPQMIISRVISRQFGEIVDDPRGSFVMFVFDCPKMSLQCC